MSEVAAMSIAIVCGVVMIIAAISLTFGWSVVSARIARLISRDASRNSSDRVGD